MTRLLARERTIAPPGFDRWLVPPAALAVHLCIGQVYALGVFWGPLSRLAGPVGAAPWSSGELAAIFTVAIVTLGLTTALAGRRLDEAGPRAVIFAAACFFGGGFLVSALGVRLHQIALLYLGSGVLGGVGLGLGYVGPIPTLIRFFPDRRGLATGLAIMGFGGGAMIAAPLSTFLMARLAGTATGGVAETFTVLGALYFVVMTAAAFAIRTPPAAAADPPQEDASLTARAAVRTPRFYLLWVMLAVNVVAGVGILGEAPDLLRQKMGAPATAAAVAGFVGLLSLFNMAGRIIFAAASDHLGRPITYTVLLLCGAGLYLAAPLIGAQMSVALFVLQYAVMVSFYGGGFATIPAYLADVFGPRFVGAVHGRLLTAWSAGVLGWVALAAFRDHQIAAGLARPVAQAETLQIMGALLLVGLVCNWLIRVPAPVPAAQAPANAPPAGPPPAPSWRRPATLLAAWTLVAAPIAWGVSQTIAEAAELELSWRLALTLFPLALGIAVTVFFYYLDKSRFAVRGVAGPYFASVALLFALYASLMATEVWQRSVRATALGHSEIAALDSAVRIAEGVHPGDRRVRLAVQSPDPEPALYAIAGNGAFFAGQGPANAAFYQAIGEAHGADAERKTLIGARLAPEKLFSLLLFGLLTQVAIAFCQAGSIRAIGVTVMLFSIAFAASVGILEL
ncbi:MAG TPA: OFA family MFS transporter, partial [Caulobacteraceae bacterium]|nr:OFA family MFS transporter [Caulobacteraceae bacterium]